MLFFFLIINKKKIQIRLKELSCKISDNVKTNTQDQNLKGHVHLCVCRNNPAESCYLQLSFLEKSKGK